MPDPVHPSLSISPLVGPGVPSAERMAQLILRLPDGTRPDRAQLARAFGQSYEDIWRPASGSLLYSGRSGSAKRRTRVTHELSAGSLQPDVMERWAVAFLAHGPAVFGGRPRPASLDKWIGMLQSTTWTWAQHGTLLCGQPPKADWSEISQHILKTCTLLASGDSLVRLGRLTIAASANSLDVTLGSGPNFSQKVPIEVRMRNTSMIDAVGVACGPGRPEVWPAMLEYAYRQFVAPNGSRDDFSCIQSLWPSRVLADLTGQATVTLTGSDVVPWSTLLDANDSFSVPAVAWTKDPPSHTSMNIQADHAYSVVGVIKTANGAPSYVVLRNPSASSDPLDPPLVQAFQSLFASRWGTRARDVKNGLVPVPIGKLWSWFDGLTYVP